MENTMPEFTKREAAAFVCSEYMGKAMYKCAGIPAVGKSIANKRTHPKKIGGRPVLGSRDGRKAIASAVLEGKPYMAGRFGTVEGLSLIYYWENLFRHKGDLSRYPQKQLDVMCKNAGFFPNDVKALEKWCMLEMDACRDVDLLGLMHFVNEDWIVRKLCPQAILTDNGALGSATDHWTHALEGKKVLVVHPFTDTITKQYTEKRERIFPDTNTLPPFELKCVKAVQTIADATDSRFKDWFEALDYMTEEIAAQDFEVCLLGCGAYGFQLASRVKRMGKIAVHMGGCLQTLFGIRGARWDKKFSYWYNDAWVTPSESERPEGFEKIEGGCYW